MLRMKTTTAAADILLREEKDARQAVLVCVTDQQSCRRLIIEGARMASRENLRLLVLSVQPKLSFGKAKNDILEQLFLAASEFDAEMSVYYSDDAIGTTNAFVRRNHIACFVTGMPSAHSAFSKNLRQSHPEIRLHCAVDAFDFGSVDSEIEKKSKLIDAVV